MWTEKTQCLLDWINSSISRSDCEIQDHCSRITSVIKYSQGRRVATALIGGGGGEYSYSRVMPD